MTVENKPENAPKIERLFGNGLETPDYPGVTKRNDSPREIRKIVMPKGWEIKLNS